MLLTLITNLNVTLDFFPLLNVGRLVDLLIKLVQNGNKQLKKSSCGLLAHILCRTRTVQARNKILSYFNGQLEELSSNLRINYILFVYYACEYLSRKLFVNLNFISILTLANDKISNVQIALIKVMPTIRLMVPEYHLEFLSKFNLA